MKWKSIFAKDLREKKTIESKSGVYKWWAPKKQFNQILKTLEIRLKDEELKWVENKDDLFCIYVGQAESLKDRLLGNHINGRRKSTLRTSIGAIILKEKGPTDIDKNVNVFIDSLKIEYKFVKQDELNVIEKNEIGRDYLRILNGQHNGKNSLRKQYKITGKLTALRKKFNDLKSNAKL